MHELFYFTNYIPFFILNKKIKENKNLQDVFNKLLIVLKFLQNTFNQNEVKLINENNFQFEGISQLHVSIAETPHPIERGKFIKFKPIYLPGIIGFVIQFDKNCQDEESSDQLFLNSWFQNKPKGNQTSINNAILSRTIHLNYKVKTQQPTTMIMIGDTLNIKFTASLVAKQNLKSLSQWGYRLKIRPIYPSMVKFDANHNDYSVNIYFQHFIRTMENVSISIRFLIDYFLKGYQRDKKQNQKFLLEWNILHQGLTYLSTDQFLISQNDEFLIKNEIQQHKMDLYNFTNESELQSILNQSKQQDKISIGDFKEMEMNELIQISEDENSAIFKLIHAINNLQGEPFFYKAEKMRPFFFKDLQILWQQLFNLIILSYIKHTNLLQLININNDEVQFLLQEQNVIDILKKIAQKKNIVIGFMIKELEQEREKQSLIQTAFETIKEYCYENIIKPKVMKKKENQKQFENQQSKREKIISLMKKSKKKGKKKKTTHDKDVQKEEIDDNFTQISPQDFYLAKESPKVKQQILQFISDHYDNKEEKLQKLFEKLSLTFTRENKVNFEFLMKYLLDIVEKNLLDNIKEDRFSLELQITNPYNIIYEMMKERVEFLLRIDTKKSSNKNAECMKNLKLQKDVSVPSHQVLKEQEPFMDDKLVPLGVYRSLTSDSRNKKKNKKNQQKIETWIENYKTWKNMMTDKQENVKSPNCSPTYAVTQFLTLQMNLNIKSLEEQFLKASNSATLRVIGMQQYLQILNVVEGTWLEKYFSNVTSSIFSELNLFSNIKVSNQNFKEIIFKYALEIMYKYQSKIIEITNSMKLIKASDFHKCKLQMHQNSEEFFGENLNTFNNNLKQLIIYQIEIYSLSNNVNFQNYLQNFQKYSREHELISKYLTSTIQLLLFCLNAQYLSFDFREQSNYIRKLHSICNLIKISIQKSYDQQEVIKIYTSLLTIELGFQNDSVNQEILLTINDLVNKERIKFLMNELSHLDCKEIIKNEKILQMMIIVLNTTDDNRIIDKTLKIMSMFNKQTDLFQDELFLKNFNINSLKIKEEDLLKLKDNNFSLDEKQSIFNLSKEIKSQEFTNHRNLLEYILGQLGGDFKFQTQETANENDDYKIMCHFQNEQGLISLIRLFYFWEISHPSFSSSLPKTIKQYIEQKSKQNTKNDKIIKNGTQSKQIKANEDMSLKPKIRMNENICNFIPEINMFESQMNLGWELNTNNYFQNFITKKDKPKEIVVKQIKTFLNTKILEQLLTQLVENTTSLQLPREKELKEKRKQIQDEQKIDQFNDGFGNCIDLMMENWSNLPEKLKEVQEDEKKTQNSLISIIKMDKKKSLEEMKTLKQKIEQKKNELLQKSKALYTTKKEKPKSQDHVNLQEQKLPRKKSEFISLRKKQEEEFLQTYKFLKILTEITKNVVYMGQHLNYTGYSVIVISSQFFKDKLQKVEEFAYLMKCLSEDKIDKINPSDHITDQSILNNLKTFFQSINKAPNKDEFVFSIVKESFSDNYNSQLNFISQLQVPQEDVCKYINKASSINQYLPLGITISAKIRSLQKYILTLCQENIQIKKHIQHLLQQFLTSQNNDEDDISIGMILLTMNWNHDFVCGEKIFNSKTNEKYSILGNSRNIGKKYLFGKREGQMGILNLKGDYYYLENELLFLDFFVENIDLLYQQLERMLQIVEQGNDIIPKLKLLSLLNIFNNALKFNNRKIKPEFRRFLLTKIGQIYQDTKFVGSNFVMSIENLLDYQIKKDFIVPINIKSSKNYSFVKNPNPKKKTSISIEQKKDQINLSKQFTMTKSSHINNMQMNHQKITEFKMLKFWEKHIIPKIHSFVKGTLSTFEIEDFTEQMRIELRKNNFSQASHIAYILCDQKLPSNCYLPGLNYDWNSLNMEEINIGQWVCIKIKDERTLFSSFFVQFQKIGLNFVMGMVIQKNFSIDSVCVLVYDINLTNTFSVWIPQQAIRPIENTIKLPSYFYDLEMVQQNLNESFQIYHKALIRNILMKDLYLEELKLSEENTYEILKLTLQYEFQGDCLNKWIEVNGKFIQSNKNNDKFDLLFKKIINHQNLNFYLQKIDIEIHNLIEYFKQEYYHCDLQQSFKDQFEKYGTEHQFQHNHSNLNIFQHKETINGLVVEFETTSNLFKCSGLKFFNDLQGVELIKHIQASQQQVLSDLEPIIFNQSDVFYEFYYNKEALPPYISAATTTQLYANIYAIPYSWNFLMWSIDSLTSYFALKNDSDNMVKIIQYFLKLFKEFQGPNVVRKYLFKMLSRILIKIRFMNQHHSINESLKALFKPENFNITQVFDKFNELMKIQTAESLFSNLLQEMIEFASIFLICNNELQLDQDFSKKTKEIEEISIIFLIAEFLKTNQLNDQIKKDLANLLDAKRYYQNFFLIQNLPSISQKLIKSVIEETLQQNKIKILVSNLDIYIPCDTEDNTIGYAVVLYDGWNPLGIEDLKENEEEQKEEIKPQVDRQWQCERCTLLNADSSDICCICEAPKPANPIYPEEELQKAQEEEKLDKRDIQQRINQFIEQFLVNIERVTPDKRITVKHFNNQSDSEISQFKESNELTEFFLIRMTDENFSEKINQVGIEIYQQDKNIWKEEDIENEDDFLSYLLSKEPCQFFDFIGQYGYDFWLEKSCINQHNIDIELIPMKNIHEFQLFFEDIYHEVDDLSNYDPLNFRIEFKNPLMQYKMFEQNFVSLLKYKESKEFYYNLMRHNNMSNFQIRSSLGAIYLLNKHIRNNFKYLIMTTSAEITRDQTPLDLASLFFQIREYFCMCFKNLITDTLLEETSVQRDSTPKIIIERITKEKLIMVNEKQIKEDNKSKETYDQKCLLIQAYKQVKQISPHLLRPLKPRGNDSFICFEVIFKGEHVMGESGPYRQFFTDIINEIQHKEMNNNNNFLDLLIPTPNQLAELGDHKDKFTINPSCKSSYHLHLYEFLGILMGCAFRTEIYFSLDLPKIFWKKMVKERIEEKDIEELDKGVIELVRFIKNASEDVFEDSIFENFTTYLSDKTQVELIPGGRDIKVNIQNRQEYIEKLLKTRISEADSQIDSIRKGFTKIVPEVLLSCLSSTDLEKKICGAKEVDFSILRKNTRYSGNLKEDSELIKNFWEVLYDLSEKDKLLFVKFCWGQERLPTSLQGFQNRSTRFMIKPALYDGNQDGILPRADTCFFNFELPNYSSKEIMQERILLAIHTDCDSMNAEEKQDDVDLYPEDGMDLYLVQLYL